MNRATEYWDRAVDDPERRDLHGYPAYDVDEVADKVDGKLLLDGFGRVLDLGCGIGRLTKCLARQYPGADFVGLDVAPRLIEQALVDAPFNAHFIVGRDDDIPAGVNITAAYSISVFQHLPHDIVSHYIKRVADELPLGGRFVFTVSLGEQDHFLNHQCSIFDIAFWAKAAAMYVLDVETDDRGWTWVTMENA